MSAAPWLPSRSSRARRRPWTVLTLAAVLGITGACGAAGGQPVDQGAAGLLEGSWVVEAVEGPARGEAESVRSIVFDVRAASIEATTGCRRLLGSYTFVGDHAGSVRADRGIASFTLPGRSTEDCPAGHDRTAEAFTELMEQVERWSREGDRLTLEGPRGSVVLLPAD